MIGMIDAGRGRRWARSLAALAALLAAGTGWGQVTLDTAVAKVETTLDGGGRARRELVPAEQVVPGEELRYTISFSNGSETLVDAGRIVITNPLPEGTVYVPGSAGGRDTRVEYSTDGESFSGSEPAGGSPAPGGDGVTELPEAGGGPGASGDGGARTGVRSLRWTYEEDLPPGASGEVYFHVRML